MSCLMATTCSSEERRGSQSPGTDATMGRRRTSKDLGSNRGRQNGGRNLRRTCLARLQATLENLPETSFSQKIALLEVPGGGGELPEGKPMSLPAPLVVEGRRRRHPPPAICPPEAAKAGLHKFRSISCKRSGMWRGGRGRTVVGGGVGREKMGLGASAGAVVDATRGSPMARAPAGEAAHLPRPASMTHRWKVERSGRGEPAPPPHIVLDDSRTREKYRRPPPPPSPPLPFCSYCTEQIGPAGK